MNTILFVASMCICIPTTILVRLYVLPTCVLLPFLRSRSEYLRMEALYCIAEHGSGSAAVAQAVLENLLDSDRRMEEEAKRALTYLAAGLLRATDALQVALRTAGSRQDKKHLIEPLVKLFKHSGKKNIRFVEELLKLAKMADGPGSSVLRETARALLTESDFSVLRVDTVEYLLIEVSKQSFRSDGSWTFGWRQNLVKLANHLGGLYARGRYPENRVELLENELGLLVMQHPKSSAVSICSEVLKRLRHATDS